jgi:hypothetical protein
MNHKCMVINRLKVMTDVAVPVQLYPTVKLMLAQFLLPDQTRSVH